jgi:hypothetical protein
MTSRCSMVKDILFEVVLPTFGMIAAVALTSIILTALFF